MMDFARKQEPVREQLDLHGLIDDLFEFCASSAAQNNVLLENRTPAILPQVMADRVQIEQVFLNLILNAIESCQTKPEDTPLSVWIDASLVKNEQVIISVYDQGEGLAGDVEQLFEQFFTTKAEGLGMGLSISRSLIEAHGGQLCGEKSSGKGSVFHVTLPLSLTSVEELNE
jgi:two-component system sensor kinase FixL